jgi:hypothetical protein
LIIDAPRRRVGVPADRSAPGVGEEGRAMRGNRGLIIGALILAVGVVPGCQSAGTKRPSTVISPAPAVSDAGNLEGESTDRTVSTTPRTVTFVDRHPLFKKPREYWDSSGDKKIVKAAAATFIGVPAGFVGEVKQIFVGAPPETRY